MVLNWTRGIAPLPDNVHLVSKWRPAEGAEDLNPGLGQWLLGFLDGSAPVPRYLDWGAPVPAPARPDQHGIGPFGPADYAEAVQHVYYEEAGVWRVFDHDYAAWLHDHHNIIVPPEHVCH